LVALFDSVLARSSLVGPFEVPEITPVSRELRLGGNYPRAPS